MRYPKYLGSSVDPEKLATTVRGHLLGIIPVVILDSGLFGVTLDISELDNLVEVIASAITAIGLAISSVMVVYGAIRKIIMKFKKPI